MVAPVLVLVVVCATGVLSSPLPANFIGDGTNELATALLQGFQAENDNQVFSPLGYSAVLAIFAEGARGESRSEIASALHFPDDVSVVRTEYRRVLQRLMAKNYTGDNDPELKNWFYVYKNYSVEEDLVKTLKEYYLTEVKLVERPEMHFEDEKHMLVPEEKPMEEEKPEETKEKKPEVVEEVKPEQTPVAEVGNEKKVLIPEPKPVEEILKPHEETLVPELKPEVEKAVLGVVENTETVHKVDSEEASSNNVKEPDVLLSDKPKEDELGELPGTNNVRDRNHLVPERPEEVETATVKVFVVQEPSEVEAMVAEQRSHEGVLDHFSGMTDSSLKIKGKGPQSQMIIFNGLYYRGDWKIPFVKKPPHESKVFYKSEREKVTVPTIHSEGNFLTGELPGLDTRVIELPYKGDRYSLLLLVPNSRDGLTKLIADIDGVSLGNLRAHLVEKPVEVCLPTFELTTISKPISSGSKLRPGLSAVKSIFDPTKADLSGISKQDPGLYVEELVQMVTFKVEGDRSETNFLTAGQLTSRTDFDKFQINHPFLFFLRDNIEDIIVVTGKVVDPTPQPDFFTSWEKEEEEKDKP